MTDEDEGLKLSKDREQQFTKIFSGVVITSLFIFIVILVPYVNVLSEYYADAEDLSTNSSALNGYLDIGYEMKQLRLDVVTLPDDIKEMAKLLDNIRNTNHSYMVGSLYCYYQLLNLTEWKECRLRDDIEDKRHDAVARVNRIRDTFGSINSSEQYNEKYMKIFNDSASVTPEDLEGYPQLHLLSKILNPSFPENANDSRPDITQSSDLILAINQTFDNFQKISDQSNLWNGSNVTEEEINRLRNESFSFLNRNQVLFSFQWDEEFKGGQEDIVESALRVEELASNLSEAVGTQQEKLGEIEARLEGFESPFGRIPLGFGEIVFLFPFGVAVGFLVCFYLLDESERFRRYAFRSQKKENSRSGEPSDNRKKSYVREYVTNKHLWYEPTLALSKQLLQVSLLLFIPGIMFGASIILIVYGWWYLPSESEELSADLQAVEEIPRLYSLLYSLGFVFIVYCYWLIFGKMRKNFPDNLQE